MFQIDPDSMPLSLSARLAIRMTHIAASQDDMVRICETDGFHTHIRSEVFSARTQHDAMSHALAYLEAAWEYTVPLNRVSHALKAYCDLHGVWCVDCGNSVYTGEDGEYVCSNPGCCNYDSDNCPAWVKELHNVA